MKANRAGQEEGESHNEDCAVGIPRPPPDTACHHGQHAPEAKRAQHSKRGPIFLEPDGSPNVWGLRPPNRRFHNGRGAHKDHGDAAKAAEMDHGVAGGPPALPALALLRRGLESQRAKIGCRQAKRTGHERHGSLPQESGWGCRRPWGGRSGLGHWGIGRRELEGRLVLVLGRREGRRGLGRRGGGGSGRRELGGGGGSVFDTQVSNKLCGRLRTARRMGAVLLLLGLLVEGLRIGLDEARPSVLLVEGEAGQRTGGGRESHGGTSNTSIAQRIQAARGLSLAGRLC